MIGNNIVFGGGGNGCPAMMAWVDPGVEAKPWVLSEFQRGYSVYALAVSPNGQRIAGGTKAGLVRVHAIDDATMSEDAPILFEVYHPPAVFGLAFCTEDILATGGYDGRIRLWSVSHREQLGEISAHKNGVYALRGIGSLVLASIGGDGFLRVWDMDTLEARYESTPFVLPQVHALTSLDYQVNSGLLMHPSRDGQIHAYDTRRDFEEHLIPVHRGDFCAVASGYDCVVTAGMADRTIRVWSPSLDATISESSTPSRVLALAWLSEHTVMVVTDDACAQLWTAGDTLRPGPRYDYCDLRTVAGLPGEFLARRNVDATRHWRDRQLVEASELIAQPDRCVELGTIIDRLNERGFSAESALLLGDAAKVLGQPLWELESRLAIVEGLGEARAAGPTLYAVGELLEALNEPALAEKYFARVLAVDGECCDAQGRIDHLQNHPMRQVCAETHVRGDLLAKDHVYREIEKSSLLNRKFCWRCILTKARPLPTDIHLDVEELTGTVKDELGSHGVDTARAALRRDLVFCENGTRTVTWLYGLADPAHPGIAFALGIHSNTRGSEITPYGIFDPGLLGIAQEVSASEHNRQIRDAWAAYADSPDCQRWLADANAMAQQIVRRLASKAVAIQDDEF